MKKSILVLLVSGLALTSNFAIAAGASSALVKAAGNHPKAVQTGASTIAANPAAQAKMDAAMAANPQANATMVQIQQAGGYTPGSTSSAIGRGGRK